MQTQTNLVVAIITASSLSSLGALLGVLVGVGVAELVELLGQQRHVLVLLEAVVDGRHGLLADQHQVAQVQQLVLRDAAVDVELVGHLEHLVLGFAGAAALLRDQALGQVLADLRQVLRVVGADRYRVRREQQGAAYV